MQFKMNEICKCVCVCMEFRVAHRRHNINENTICEKEKEIIKSMFHLDFSEYIQYGDWRIDRGTPRTVQLDAFEREKIQKRRQNTLKRHKYEQFIIHRQASRDRETDSERRETRSVTNIDANTNFL